MNQTPLNHIEVQYFGITSEIPDGVESIDLSPRGEEKLRTLRADSKLRATDVSAPVTEKLKSTLSGIFQSMNLNLTIRAKNRQCKFNGHIIPDTQTYGHCTQCAQCGEVISDIYSLRRTSVSSDGALNGQVIEPSQDYWVDQSVVDCQRGR